MPATKDFDVVVVGELNADLILRGDVAPAFGQVEKLIDDATLTLGSSSGIFACGAASLGLRVAFIGMVGDDEFGRFLKRALEARGIDADGLVMNPSLKTGLTVILSQGAGPGPRSGAGQSLGSDAVSGVGDHRALLTYLGSIAALRYADVDQARLARARHLHLGSFFLLDALRPDVPALFQAAHRLGLTVSLDTNYDPSEQWDGGLAETLRHVDIFLPNETELCAIARQTDPAAALAVLAGRVPLVAAKLGAQGALVRRGAEHASAAPLPVTVVDTTGAGDTFDAGFIYGFLAGWNLSRTLSLACVCGSLSTRTTGGTTGQPSLPEALAYLAA
jgi:sugar/nucleoside kinase (ribokinase family)